MAKVTEQQLAAAMAAFAAALGVEVEVPGTATKGQPKAGAEVRYYTEAEIEAGEGYACEHPTKPCKRLLRGPNRTKAHRGKTGHKPLF